jgi:hypothetical protein
MYTRETFNYKYFQVLALFSYFNECVERGALNYNDKVIAMYLLYGDGHSVVLAPKQIQIPKAL